MASVFKRGGKGNYVIQFYDWDGVRKERSTRTTDKRAAEQLAAKLEADAMLRRNGIIDPRDEQFAKQRDVHLTKHLEAYLADRRTKVSDGTGRPSRSSWSGSSMTRKRAGWPN